MKFTVWNGKEFVEANNSDYLKRMIANCAIGMEKEAKKRSGDKRIIRAKLLLSEINNEKISDENY